MSTTVGPSLRLRETMRELGWGPGPATDKQDNMRKIFIDCGAHNGCSVRFFRDLRNLGQKDLEEFEIFSFEPNLSFKEDLEKLGVEVIYKGVSTIDGTATFYQVSEDKYGATDRRTGASTLIHQKAEWNLRAGHRANEELTIETIDFSRWIKENFAKKDFIILKMDIEGMEYEVLQKMIDDGTINYIDELLIEFHWKKCGVSKETHDHIIAEIISRDIHLDDTWDAISYI